MKKLVFIMTGVVVLLILGLVIYNKAFKFKLTISIPADKPKVSKQIQVQPTGIKPGISPSSTATTTSSAKITQPPSEQAPKTASVESGSSPNALISKIEEWRKKYPDLFKEYPELEGLLRNMEAQKAIDLLLQSRFAGTAVEIIIYSLNSLSGLVDFGLVYLDTLQILKTKVSKDDIPGIIKLLSDSDAGVRANVIGALGLLQVKKAIPEAIRLLSDSDAGVRRSAMYALGNLQAKEVIPEII
ncbi:MAG: HEAT repeat domain-containing protein, partial [Planctomycetota bacterium]